MTPVVSENIVEKQHGHVAAHTVTVTGDGAEFGELRGARRRMEMIELGDIFPGWVVGILGPRDETRTLRSLDRIIKRRIVFEFRLLRLNVIFGVFANPGLVECGMIADEI